MVRTYRMRRGLKSSPLEQWIAGALAKQSEPHSFAPGRAGGCCECGLSSDALVHTAEASR